LEVIDKIFLVVGKPFLRCSAGKFQRHDYLLSSSNDTMLFGVAWRMYVLYQVMISAVQYCSFQNLLVQYFNIFAVIIGWPLLHD